MLPSCPLPHTQPGLNIFTWLFTKTECTLNHYVIDTSQNVINAITPVATTLFLIFVLMWAFAHLRNQIEEPVTDGAMRLIKVGLIVMIALNVTYYGMYVVDFGMHTPMALASAALGHTNSTGSIGVTLDQALNKVMDIGMRSWEKGGVTDPGPILVAIVIWVAMSIVLLFAAALILIAYFASAVLLAIGPVFILLLLFKGTQRFFELWLGQLINFMLTMVLIVLVTALLMQLIQSFLDQAVGNAAASTASVLIQMVVFGGVGVLILRQVQSLASALGGGIAMSTLGGFGATMRGAHGGLGAVSGRATRQEAARQRRYANATRYNRARKGMGNAALSAAKAVPGVGTAAAAAHMASKAFRAKNTVKRG